MADHTRVYTTEVSSSEVLDKAEAYLVGLRGFSVPLATNLRQTPPSSACEAVCWGRWSGANPQRD